MSETYEREKAKHLFCQFLRERDAWQPTCTGPNEPDSPAEPFVEVDRAYATDCFLRKNPSYERFWGDLSEVRQGIDKFTFKPEWLAAESPQCETPVAPCR
jgi:hypothetical protein